MRNSPSPPPSATNPPIPSESLFRNPRVHRQLGTPSISRPLRGFSPIARAHNGNASTSQHWYECPRRSQENGVLYFIQDHWNCNRCLSRPTLLSAEIPLTPKQSSLRRFASLPNPLPSAIQAQIDIDNDHCATGSPVHLSSILRGSRTRIADHAVEL